MANRERCIKTLLCEKTDRAPWVNWLGFQPWGETTARWKKESGIADLDAGRYFGLEPIFHVPPAHMGPVPSFDWKNERDRPPVQAHGSFDQKRGP